MAVDTLKQQGEFLVEASKQAMAALVSGYAANGRTIKKDEVADEAYALAAALYEKLKRQGWVGR
ncbi:MULTISPECIES: hypothetical protein [Burkholderia]|jgi:hypothetical protein|uniref:hypothetical protein n=1 Tax=Burkholderia TaxID=32008 RepID=UPI000A45E414|nr:MULTISPECIES: hypothetical protein [Burkholderia]MBR8007383.1 hypothetical protein [Burkholderia vietnamiensis]MBR8163530.1 hypothetical protein [Burkholderia vietnamiensis]MBR8215292.1 hypothetical protein [Burkholderia vietnamiensis]MBR8282229.1 hypothetical protein [Burkholderia vietnamiensis]MCA8011653.1 hypothetical protein [Burkholderia vietnamiensis]